MKKPLKMIWAAGDCDLMTGGKVYTITGRELLRDPIVGGTYFYHFKNDKGQNDTAASKLFVSQKRKK